MRTIREACAQGRHATRLAMRAGRSIGVAWLILMWLLPVDTASAAAFTVNSTVDAPDATVGDGICAAASGLCTLRAAIQEANATTGPSTITLPVGTYVLNVVGPGEDLAATGDLDIRQPLSIIGAGAASTVIDGYGSDRIFHKIGPIAVQLSGLTLRNGSVPHAPQSTAIKDGGGGGAIYISGGGSLTLSNVVVAGNIATSGAITIDDGGSLTVNSSTINGNTASFGGGIYNNGSVTIANTTISGNTASRSGGGIYVAKGSLSLRDSTISSNTAASPSVGGGGILVESVASAAITGSLLSSNAATNYNGGGIHSRGSLSLVNSTLSGNSARNGGGGLCVGALCVNPPPTTTSSSATLSNATLSGNSADVQGGAILNTGGSVLVRNSILANSTTGGNCAGQITSLGYNLDSGQTCALNSPGDLAGVNPQLGPLGSNGGATQTHALLAGSPAIDAGSPSPPGSSGNGCEATDQRGTPRPTDGNGDGVARCDIGAFEAPTSPTPVAVAAPILSVPVVGRTPTVVPTATTPDAGRVPTPIPPVVAAPPRPVLTAPPAGVAPATPRSQQLEDQESGWLLVLEGTEIYAVDGSFLGVAEADEWYRVIAEEDGWLLAAADPDWPVWLVDSEGSS